MDIEWPSNPVTDWFLRGYDLEAFDFVGIQEHFAEDVADLGRILDWPPVEIPVQNRTTTPEYLQFRRTEELLQKIRDANQVDVELYEQALERRRARLAAQARQAPSRNAALRVRNSAGSESRAERSSRCTYRRPREARFAPSWPTSDGPDEIEDDFETIPRIRDRLSTWIFRVAARDSGEAEASVRPGRG